MLIPIRDLNPTKRFPVVTVTLIAANVLVFIATAHGLSLSDKAAFHYGAVPCDVTSHCPSLSAQLTQAFPGRSALLSVITSMFMHADVLHIGFNMLFLWVFGNNVEDRLGRIRFVVFYFLCGFGAAALHILSGPTSAVPTIGASGAIAGVLGAYAVLWPGATIISLVPVFVFFFSVRVPAWIMIGLWFVLQLLGGAAGFGQTGSQGGVAYLAHVGGFVSGIVLILVLGGWRRRDVHPAFPGGT